MKVTGLPETALSAGATGTRSASGGDFQTMFEAALQGQAERASGSSTAHTAIASSSRPRMAAADQKAIAELTDYMKKSPEEHLREAVLKSMGLTEADLAAMPPAKRLATEEAITAKMKELMLHEKPPAPQAGAPTLPDSTTQSGVSNAGDIASLLS